MIYAGSRLECRVGYFEIVSTVLTLGERLVCCIKCEVCFTGFFVKYFNNESMFNGRKLLSFDDLWTEWLEDGLKFVFSPNTILSGRLGSKQQPTN